MKRLIPGSTGITTAVMGTLVLLNYTASLAQERVATVDAFVPHVSTVPANASKKVGIFVREKISKSAI